MRTVVVGTRPPEIDALIAQRRARGLDLFDELWNGDYHMNPAPHPRHGMIDHQLVALLFQRAKERSLVSIGVFNLGTADNYRVPAEFADSKVLGITAQWLAAQLDWPA